MNNLKAMIAWAVAGMALAGIADAAGISWLVFLAAVLGIIPLAALLGQATEDLAVHCGPRIGGFLNATFANLPELIVAGFLVLGGKSEVVKFALTGAIVSNLLLVLGAALFFGGLRRSEQSFNAKVAGMHAVSLALAEVGLIMPALLFSAAPRAALHSRVPVSVGVAGVLMVLYLASLIFSFKTHSHLLGLPTSEEEPRWSRTGAIVLLAGTAVGIAFLSDLLVGSLTPAIAALGLTTPFAGMILIPVVGNAAEHAGAIRFALHDKMDVAIEVAIGSSTQIALFVAPLLVFFSIAVGRPLDFFFSGFEVAAVGVSTAIVALVCLDGRSDWLEGAQLIAAYAIIAIAFFFLPR